MQGWLWFGCVGYCQGATTLEGNEHSRKRNTALRHLTNCQSLLFPALSWSNNMWQPQGKGGNMMNGGCGDQVWLAPTKAPTRERIPATLFCSSRASLAVQAAFLSRLHGACSMSLLLVTAIQASLCFLSLCTLEM